MRSEILNFRSIGERCRDQQHMQTRSNMVRNYSLTDSFDGQTFGDHDDDTSFLLEAHNIYSQSILLSILTTLSCLVYSLAILSVPTNQQTRLA